MTKLPPIRKAIFPVAGFGTRFLPATKAQPKEMLPIVDKPVIQYLVEEAVAAGITDIVMVTGRGKRAIEDHFDSNFELEYTLVEKEKHELLEEVRNISKLANFIYVRQPKPLGDGHAILCARNIIGNEPCAVLFGDDVIDGKVPAIKQLMDVYQETGCSVIGVKEVPLEEISNYGTVGGLLLQDGLFQVEKLVEKPKPAEAPSNLAVIGKYIITPEVFDCIERGGHSAGGEKRLIDGFEVHLKTHPIYAKILEGTRYDTGQKIGLLQANIDFALKRPDLSPELRKYLKSLQLD